MLFGASAVGLLCMGLGLGLCMGLGLGCAKVVEGSGPSPTSHVSVPLSSSSFFTTSLLNSASK